MVVVSLGQCAVSLTLILGLSEARQPPRQRRLFPAVTTWPWERQCDYAS